MFSKIFTTVKYLLTSVNFLFLITGIIVLAVGSSVQQAYNGYHSFLSERFLSLPAFCIATGIIIFLIAFFGFYGAYRENYYLIMAYAISMLVMFVFMASACIAGYALKGNTIALVQQKLFETMQLYKTDLVVTQLWDEVQSDFRCCGVNSSADWNQVPSVQNRQETTTPVPEVPAVKLPVSCCEYIYGSINVFNCTQESANLYKKGCAESFGNWVQSHIAGIAVAGVFLILMQGLVVAGAVWMARMMKQERGGFP